jgi:hypothetical protein
VSYQEPLSKHAVAISISESTDMNVLGLGNEHLVDAMAEVARHLLAMGTRLMYGGDLRPGGFTEILFELVARYRRDADLEDERMAVTNVLAWPVHITLSNERLEELSEGLRGVAELVYLSVEGNAISADDRLKMASVQPENDEWIIGLTSMREFVTSVTDARIVLGGRVDDFKGRMPGIAEEALDAMKARKPLFLLGGFGGCSRDIAEDLGLKPLSSLGRRQWAGRYNFVGLSAASLNNGLDDKENETLAMTQYVDEAITLILRGLLRNASFPSSEMSSENGK